MQVSFYEWLKSARVIYDSIYGDLKYDILRDPTFPKQATTRTDIKRYLESRAAWGSQRAVLTAFTHLWKRYTQSTARV